MTCKITNIIFVSTIHYVGDLINEGANTAPMRHFILR